MEARALHFRRPLLVLGVLSVCLVILTANQSVLADSTYSTQGVTITASLVTHSDGTATITVSVTNTSPSAIQVSSVYIYPSTDPNASCGYGVYRACFVCIESGAQAPYGIPEGVPSCGQAIAPNGSGSWTNTIYSKVIQDGQGYQLWISINNGNPVTLGTLDATNDSAFGIPVFPYQPLAVTALTAIVAVAYLIIRPIPVRVCRAALAGLGAAYACPSGAITLPEYTLIARTGN